MALVSPGISISINDQSQYVASNVGSVPLVILATAQDKTYNNSPATGTTAANAGKLQSFTSQRELVTALGTPSFQLSSAGTPVNGSELNEYGLLTAYSALGVSNRLFAIRADIDLSQLTGSGVRPVGMPDNGTYWLNTDSTEFGIYELDAGASRQTFTHVTPLIITDKAQVEDDNNFAYPVPTPINSIGTLGQYALVCVGTDGMAPMAIRLFYKATSSSYGNVANTWLQVGSTEWQNALPVVTGTALSATIANDSTLVINTVTVTLPSDGALNLADIAIAINGADIPGVKSGLDSSGRLMVFATSAAASNNVTADGKVVITDGTNSPLADAGVETGTYYCPYLFYGSSASAPTGGWFIHDTQPRPSGSIWWKTTQTGGGFSPVLEKFDASLDKWTTYTTPMYSSWQTALYALDPIGGGISVPHGTPISIFGLQDSTANGIQFFVQANETITVGTGGQLTSATPFTPGNSFIIQSSAPGGSALVQTTVTLSSDTPQSFVADILAANIPYVSARFNAQDGMYGSISLIHTAGGQISLTDVSPSTALTNGKFTTTLGTNIKQSVYGKIFINNWSDITETVKYQNSTPYTAPDSGTYWYYSNPTEIDIMINNNGWKGYQNVSSDARGYNLTSTDPIGVIISAGSAPTSQTDGTSLVKGDLWLNSADLVNFPALSRYNGATWVAIDNADHVSANGILFADARWDMDGTTDIITGTLPSTVEMLTSNFIDQDAPDYRLYPRGTLLFNMRRSGYNVKKFVKNYFNSASFPNPGTTPGTSGTLPQVADAWVTASGLNNNGAMNAGSKAQRAMIVAALSAAVDSNTDIIEDIYDFNLLVCPGYPELIPNLVNLNNNRSNTGFIIGDTPLSLKPNTVEIANWVNNTSGNGLPSVAATDPYTAIYYPSGVTNDLSGNVVVVPASHAVLRTFLYSDNVSYPWFAPAGVNRGLVSNLNNIGYLDANTGSFIHNGINQGLRDALYPLRINPITQLPGTGIVVWGQQTRSAETSARDSINVVRLENYLRTIFKTVSHGYLFEPNDTITRTSIARQIEGALNDVLAKRGLYDFLVICDTSNNTPSTIANKQLFVDVAIEPMRDVEFIYIPIALYNPGDIAALQIAST